VAYREHEITYDDGPRAMARLEGLGRLKNPVTSSGIEPATFRLVVKVKETEGNRLERDK
jgi:hypothetical protein